MPCSGVVRLPFCLSIGMLNVAFSFLLLCLHFYAHLFPLHVDWFGQTLGKVRSPTMLSQDGTAAGVLTVSGDASFTNENLIARETMLSQVCGSCLRLRRGASKGV